MGAGLASPIFLNGIGLSLRPQSDLLRYFNPDNDRALVLIQLIGGNDGLNTVIPLDQYSDLAKVRRNILIPENKILGITDEVGLHPSLGSLQNLYQDGKVNIVQSVGYPNQNRSHFRSTDIWTSGSPADEVWPTGWLGRYFQEEYPDFPENYPRESTPDPFAITMGPNTSETCQGQAGNFSLALEDPFKLTELADPLTEVAGTDEPYYDELEFLNQVIVQTNAYSETIFAAAEKGRSRAEYPEGKLAEQFRTVATLISGGLKTKVYVVSLGGFDTHANQVSTSDVLSGDHATLLQTLAEAVEAFQDDLRLLGLEHKVLGLTFSEFGRRIRSNDSLGTDHGTAAPLLLFGSCVNSGILGENPDIDRNVDNVAGVPMQFDFRDVYGSVLTDWFELPENVVKNVLQYEHEHLPVITPCAAATSTTGQRLENLETQAFPTRSGIRSTSVSNFPEMSRSIYPFTMQWAVWSVRWSTGSYRPASTILPGTRHVGRLVHISTALRLGIPLLPGPL